jgi:glucan phosphoethanolaminetransferase (alkaline phosphatase superfamily)
VRRINVIHTQSDFYWVEHPWWLLVLASLGVGAIAVLLLAAFRRPRVKRRLLNLVTVLSLLLCVAVVVLWVRSYSVADTWEVNGPITSAQSGLRTSAWRLLKPLNGRELRTTGRPMRASSSSAAQPVR